MECPICGIFLSSSIEEAQVHVNDCIDTKSTHLIINKKQSTLSTFFSVSPPSSPSISSPKSILRSLPQDFPPQGFPSHGSPFLPSQKRVMGTGFVVDAFNYGVIPNCKFYFLSHFHADHYQGLTAGFKHGVIVCSKITGNLVVAVLRVDERFIKRIELNTWVLIDNVFVMLIDAFHCPGSVMFIFKIPQPNGSFKFILHTGDFRASDELLKNPTLQGLDVKYDAIYLDTTYGDPKYCFPSQSKIIDDCCRCVNRFINKHDPRAFSPIQRLILVGSYLIGKEKIVLAISKMLDCKIYCSIKKRLVFKCMEWPELSDRLVNSPLEAQLHVVSMMELDKENIAQIIESVWPKYTHILVIKPTGWVYKPDKADGGATLTFDDHIRRDPLGQPIKRKNVIATYSVPYSEHSSYTELQNFLTAPWLRYDQIIPTVDNPKDNYLSFADYSDRREILPSWSNFKAPDQM